MHEFSIVKPIVETALGIARAHGNARVLRVAIDVGAARQVMPELLEFAFMAACKDTLAEGARLDWRSVPLKAECGTCGVTYAPGELDWRCPACAAGGGRMIAGDELVLRTVEIEEASARKG